MMGQRELRLRPSFTGLRRQSTHEAHPVPEPGEPQVHTLQVHPREPLRRHADHRVRAVSQLQRPAQNVRVAAEVALPEAVAQNRYPLPASRVFGWREIATQGRPYTQQVEVVARGQLGVRLERVQPPADDHAPVPVCGYLHRLHGAAKVAIIRVRHIAAYPALAHEAAVALHQDPLHRRRLPHMVRWAQQQPVHYAEHGGVRPHAQRKRQYYTRRQPRIPHDSADRLATDVRRYQHCLPDLPPRRRATIRPLQLTAPPLLVAESAPGLLLGLRTTHARRQQLRHCPLTVERQLFLDVPRHPPDPEDPLPALHHAAASSAWSTLNTASAYSVQLRASDVSARRPAVVSS